MGNKREEYLVDIQKTATFLKVFRVKASSYEEAIELALKLAETADFNDPDEEQFDPTYKDLHTCKASSIEFSISEIKTMWEEFEDVPVDEDERIETKFYEWPVGTPKMEIWHWFDSMSPTGLAKDFFGLGGE